MALADVDKQFARVTDQRVHFVQKCRATYNWMHSLPVDPNVQDPIVQDDDLHDVTQWAELDPADYLPVEFPAGLKK